MSNNSTPPPPPFPLSVQKSDTELKPILKPPKLKECRWAAKFPDLQKACFFARVCLFGPPKEWQLKWVDPILQLGPTCGLTALSMIFNGIPSSKMLLELANAKKYSNNGEMFSARQLDNILECIISIRIKDFGEDFINFQHFVRNGSIDCDEIRELLKNGAVLLVAYDPDVNHAPCLRKGHKAHWALVLGYLIDEFDHFHVITRHGKTRNLAVWSLKSLSDSNANLYEFAQPTGHRDAIFVIPTGGISGDEGLREKCIVIHGLNAKELND